MGDDSKCSNNIVKGTYNKKFCTHEKVKIMQLFM